MEKYKINFIFLL